MAYCGNRNNGRGDGHRGEGHDAYGYEIEDFQQFSYYDQNKERRSRHFDDSVRTRQHSSQYYNKFQSGNSGSRSNKQRGSETELHYMGRNYYADNGARNDNERWYNLGENTLLGEIGRNVGQEFRKERHQTDTRKLGQGQHSAEIGHYHEYKNGKHRSPSNYDLHQRDRYVLNKNHADAKVFQGNYDSSSDGEEFADGTLETGFDEPVPDYGAVDIAGIHLDLTDSGKKPGHAYHERSVPFVGEAEANMNGRDNLGFTFEEKDIRRYEKEGETFGIHEISGQVFADRGYHDARRQRQRDTAPDIYRRPSDSDSDEGLIIERKGGGGWSVRRRHRGHRATIATPLDKNIADHDNVKTCQRLKRSKSEIRSRGNNIEERDSVFREVDDDENKLPSNRHTRTKSLKERIEILHNQTDASAHTFAETLR